MQTPPNQSVVPVFFFLGLFIAFLGLGGKVAATFIPAVAAWETPAQWVGLGGFALVVLTMLTAALADRLHRR